MEGVLFYYKGVLNLLLAKKNEWKSTGSFINAAT